MAVASDSVFCDPAIAGSSDVVRMGGEEDRSVERRRRRGSVADEDILLRSATQVGLRWSGVAGRKAAQRRGQGKVSHRSLYSDLNESKNEDW